MIFENAMILVCIFCLAVLIFSVIHKMEDGP